MSTEAMTRLTPIPAGDSDDWEFIRKDDDSPEKPYVYVFGPVLVPDVVDKQGDVATAEVIKDAAHDFLEQSRTVGLMHTWKLKPADAVIVESYVAPCDMTIEKHKIKAGTWLVGTRFYNEDLKKMIRSGKLKGYSIGGKGKGHKVA